MRGRTTGALSLAVVAILVAGTACGTTTGTGATGSGPVSIGLLYPTSGPQGTQGTEEERGARLAAEWANEHGGVHGRPVRLVEVSADRAEAVPGAMDALVAQGVRIVVGSHSSAVSAAGAQEATTRGLLLWETGAVGQVDPDVAGGTNFIRLAPMGANLGRAAIDFVHDQVTPRLGINHPLRYAVAYVDDPYGRAVGQGAIDEVAGRGQTLAGAFSYDLATVDYPALAARIAAARPDVLFVSAYLEDGVALRRAVVAAHVPLAVNIGTSSSYCLRAFGARLGADAVGLFASDKPDAAAVNPSALTAEGRRALAWVQARYRHDYHEDAGAPALSGFSNTYALFVHVLPAAGPLQPSNEAASVAAAALAVKLPVGTLANGGGLDVAPPGSPDAGANRAAAGVIWEWVAPGQRVVVWPPPFATHPIVT